MNSSSEQKFKDNYRKLQESKIPVVWKLIEKFLSVIAIGIGIYLLSIVVIFIMIIFFIFLAWLLKDYGFNFYRKMEALTITASSGDRISVAILCDEWLEANKGILTGERSDNEKIFHAIRKMIEEKKVAMNE